MTSQEASGVPLTLSSRQQHLIAELCRVLSGYLREGEQGRDDEAMDATLLEAMQVQLERFDATSMEMGQLYNKFHRSGRNSY